MQRTTAVIAAAILVAVTTFHSPQNLTYASTELSAYAPVSVRDSGEPTDRQPEIYQGSFLDTSTSAMLARIGVTVFPEDQVFAFPDPLLGIGSQIKVFRALPVIITDAGAQRLVRTWKHSVPEFMAEQNIQLGSQDKINLAADAILPAQSTAIEFTIIRVATRSVVETSGIEFTTTYQDDPKLEKGLTKVVTEGEVGTLATTYSLRYEDGRLVSKTVSSKEVVRKPVAKVIARGTKPKVTYLSSGQYAAYLNEAAAMYNVPADKLSKLMYCESGGRVDAVNGGLYYGLFQFNKSTWAATAYGSIDILDPRAQVLAAASLWSQRSWRWPACSASLGL